MPAALCWWLIVASLLVAPVGAQPQGTSAEALMGAAQVLQEVEGRYAEAIAAYRKVLAAPGVSRATAARAQLMIGPATSDSAERGASRVPSRRLQVRGSEGRGGRGSERLAALESPAAQAGRQPQAGAVGGEAEMTGRRRRTGGSSLWRSPAGNVVIQDLRTGQTATDYDAPIRRPIERNDSEPASLPTATQLRMSGETRTPRRIELHVYQSQVGGGQGRPRIRAVERPLLVARR